MNTSKFPHCPHCNEQVIPDTKACPACGGTLDGLLKEGDGDELKLHPLSHSRWQKVSMGLDLQGRIAGMATVGVFIAFLLLSWLLYLNTPDPTDTLLFVFSAVGLFSAYDVWAFTHGKPTSITIYARHKSKPFEHNRESVRPVSGPEHDGRLCLGFPLKNLSDLAQAASL